MVNSIILGYTDINELRETAKIAYRNVKFYKELFDKKGIDPEEFNTDILKKLEIKTEPEDIRNPSIVPSYVNKIFSITAFSSGSTGVPKSRYITNDDFERIKEQIENFLNYRESLRVTLSLFPPPQSSSGIMSYEGFNRLSRDYGIPIKYIWVQPSLAQNPEIIEKIILSHGVTFLMGLPTSVWQLSNKLSKDAREKIELLCFGGENVPHEMYKAFFETLPNLRVVIDGYGTTEDGLSCYKEITKDGVKPFECRRSAIVCEKSENLNQDECYIHITSVGGQKKLGLILFNYSIGDVAKLNAEGKIMEIYRKGDSISLAGAKITLSEIGNAIYNVLGNSVVDFRIEYYPISSKNQEPKAIIYIAAKRSLSSQDIRKIKEEIYRNNYPVYYEIEDAKRAKLEIREVPADELLRELYPKPGKPVRLKIIS